MSKAGGDGEEGKDGLDEEALLQQAMALSMRNADSVVEDTQPGGAAGDGDGNGDGDGDGGHAVWPFQASLASKIADANSARLCEELASRRGPAYAHMLHVDAKIHPVLGLLLDNASKQAAGSKAV